MNRPQLALIMSGFPRRSETFALHEIRALQERGLLAALFATKPGDGLPPHPQSQSVIDCVQIVPLGDAYTQAAWIAERVAGQSIHGVHGYFAHTPTDVAIHLAQHLAVPYSFSVHAKDARKISPTVLAARACASACVIACNQDVALALRGVDAPLRVLPHGVDLQRFRPQPFPPDAPFKLLAVGRLVEKKGFEVLIEAVASLAVPFQLRIVGEGPQQERLATAIAARELGDRVTLCGSKTHDELVAEYAQAHVVVVPSIEDHSGDRDGLPNVVLEALASGRAVVASLVGAIGSAITHRENGLLLPPDNAAVLATALASLALNRDLREQLGTNGRMRVERDYDLHLCTAQFCSVLEEAYA